MKKRLIPGPILAFFVLLAAGPALALVFFPYHFLMYPIIYSPPPIPAPELAWKPGGSIGLVYPQGDSVYLSFYDPASGNSLDWYRGRLNYWPDLWKAPQDWRVTSVSTVQDGENTSCLIGFYRPVRHPVVVRVDRPGPVTPGEWSDFMHMQSPGRSGNAQGK